MKTINVSVMPACDLCGHADGIYDAPTLFGSWANMCETCYKKQPQSQIGSKRALKVKKNIEAHNTVVQGILISDPEEAQYDSVADIQCPMCNCIRSLEPDAEGTYICEDCGATVKFDVFQMCLDALQ